MKTTIRLTIILFALFICLTSAAMGQGAGYAIKFDSTGFIGILHGAIPPTGNFTVESWVYGIYLPGHREFLSQKDSTSGNGRNFYIGYQLGDSSIRAGDYWQNTLVKFPFNAWNHIAVVKDTPFTYLYINGILKNTSSSLFKNPRQNDSLFFGRQWDGNEKWKGSLDEVRIWNTALDSITIRQWINKSVTGSHPNFANLKGYWKFDEGTGTTTADASGNGNNGTLVNGPTWITSSAPINLPQLTNEYTPDANTVLLMHFNEDSTNFVGDASEYGNHGIATGTTITNGRFGKARKYYGTSGVVQINDSSSFDFSISKTLTIECWLKADSFPPDGERNIIGKEKSDFSEYEWLLTISADSMVRFFVGSFSGTSTPNIVKITKGIWYHIAGVWDGNAGIQKLYINGVLMANNSNANTTLQHQNYPIRIGYLGQGSQHDFNGLIDEVRISNIARTSFNVPSLVASYPFNNNANDESGNGNNGAVNGATITNDRFGNANSAYGFDGVSNRIEMGTWFYFDNFAISMWVKAGITQQSYSTIIENNHNTFRSWSCEQVMDSISVYNFFVRTSQGPSNARFVLTPNVWKHVVLQKDQNSIKVFIDGANVSSTVASSSVVYEASKLGIGRQYNLGDNGPNRFWNGQMDDITIYNRALTTNEIDSLYHLNNWANGKVDAISPAQNALNVAPSANVQVTFNTAVSTSSFNDTTSFIVSGSVSGRHRGSFSFSGGNTIATFNPTTDFKNGEVVTVNVSSNVKDNTNTSVQSFVSQFTVDVSGGNGVFTNTSTVTVGNLPIGMTSGDLDNDGDIDIVTANDASNNLSLLKNNGLGNFQTDTVISVGDGSDYVILGELNNDGNLDIVVTNRNSNTITVILNNGNSNYTLLNTNVSSYPHSITYFDADGDGDLDIAVLHYFPSNSVSILLNDGNGNLTVGNTFGVGSYPNFITSGDWDSDGDFDLAVSNSVAEQIAILKNDGKGIFTQTSTVGVGSNPWYIVANDCDSDGDLDLAVANSYSDYVSILKNDGNGTYIQSSQINVNGEDPVGLVSGDIENDGDLDLISANGTSNNISILINNATGTYSVGTTYLSGGSPRVPITSDFDNDGDIDIAVANITSNTVSIFKNNLANPSLVAYYPFNNNANDSSVYGNNGTVNGATITSDRFGNANSAYGFDGSSSYINTTENLMPISGDFSVACWALSNQVEGPREILSQGGTGEPFYLGYHRSAENYQIRVGDNWQNTGESFIFNSWQNIVVIKRSDSTFLYVNGNLKQKRNSIPNPATGNIFLIGKQCPPTTGENWNGFIDDIRIYNRALTTNEIDSLYHIGTLTITATSGSNGSISPSGNVAVDYARSKQFTITPNFGYHIDSVIVDNAKVDSTTSYTFNNVTANHTIRAVFKINLGLAAYYPFTNGSLNDSSGYGNNGTNNGATDTTDRFGNANSAYSFNGNNNLISLPASSLPSINDFTASIWFKMNAYNSVARNYLADFRGNTSLNGKSFALIIDNDNKVHHYIDYPSGGYTEYYTSISSPIGNWHQTILVRQGSTLKVYYDGIQIADTYTPLSIPPKSDALSISDGAIFGNRSGTNSTNDFWFNGVLDDIRIYNRALSASEIDSLYHLNGWATNTAPIAHDTSVTTNEDTPKSITFTATDAENNTLTFSILDSTNHGTLTGTPPNIAYTPATNYNGNDTLFFRVSDSVLFDTGRVVVTVTPVNDAPIITNDASGITNEDVSFSDTLSATDVDNTTLSFKVLAQGIKGTLTITDSTKGLFTYTPTLNANGNDTMRFRVSDGALYDTGFVFMTINAVNDKPIAIDTSITTNEDIVKSGNVRATDVDNVTLSYIIVTNGAKGSVAITNATTGAFTYTPTTNQNGSDVFTFRAFDGSLNDTGIVNVTINAVNDAPIAIDTSITTNEDVAVNSNVRATDVDNVSLQYFIVTNGAKGSVAITNATTG
ncbi:MAG: LamG-like jellyroll fold domain-containing protein, partial [Bacteroidota bacterium]